METIQSLNGKIEVKGSPDKCPFCHNKITPNLLYGYRHDGITEVMSLCPNKQCNKSFIGYYGYLQSTGYFEFNGKTSVGNLASKEFTETINSISENFTTIYNQAYSAEQQGLTEICGVGYRKALEFLIKDYTILNRPDDSEVIEKKLLGACISGYIDDNKIKTVASRAAWLGNDETHYIRKWEGKNLNDLKKLIDLTVHWIEMESLTKSFESEMPD